MRFYLDACTSYHVLEPIKAVYQKHEFLSYQSEGLQDVKDIPLFNEMARLKVDVFLTVDRQQLYNEPEKDAIRAGGCHWLGFHQAWGNGPSQLARISAVLLNSVTFILDNPPTVPTAFVAKTFGREHHQVFTKMQSLAAV